MTRQFDIDRGFEDWLSEGPSQLPEHAIDRIVRHINETDQRRPIWLPGRKRMNRMVLAIGGMAAVLVLTLVGAGLFLSLRSNAPGVAGEPSPTASPSPTIVQPTAGANVPSPTPSGEPATSSLPWPQSGLEEVREAQELADAGDPDYTWQVDSHLFTDEWGERVIEPGVQIAERFLGEELGWDAALFNIYDGLEDDGASDGILHGLVYLRCAPGETNSLYPMAGSDEFGLGADKCGPTIDDLRYETVSIDLLQPARRGPRGIWVVTGWRMTAPFAQADPRVVQSEAEAQLEEFLQARVDGEGAEGYVNSEVPLLYATTGGAPYERFEIEQVRGPGWPDAEMEYAIRLFAEGGDTVVEQLIEIDGESLGHNARSTTENGQPVPVKYEFLDAQVSLDAPYPWGTDGDTFHWYRLSRDDHRDERIEPVGNPRPVGEGCASGAEPADAEALAHAIESDPDLVATAPVAVTLLGRAALTMDVSVAPGASVCEDYPATLVLTHDLGGNRRELPLDQGSRMRLYLVDAPEGSSLGILAVAIVAPESRFESLVDAAAPIIESMEFHVP